MDNLIINKRMRGRFYACTRWRWYIIDGVRSGYSYIAIEINPNLKCNKTDDIIFWSNLISAESLHYILMLKNEPFYQKASYGIDRLKLHTGTKEQIKLYNSGLNESRLP